MRDRAKSRIREAVTVAAAVSGAALGVGVAVAATSHTLVSAPRSATAPDVAEAQLAPPPAQVRGYTILRPSSLVMDTPSGLRILSGTGLAVTGNPELEGGPRGPARSGAERAGENTPPRHGRPAEQAAPAPAPASTPSSPPADAEADFPGRGEEHRSDRADPRRSERAEEQADVLMAQNADRRKADKPRGRAS